MVGKTVNHPAYGRGLVVQTTIHDFALVAFSSPPGYRWVLMCDLETLRPLSALEEAVTTYVESQR